MNHLVMLAGRTLGRGYRPNLRGSDREMELRLCQVHLCSGKEIVVVTHGLKKKTAEVPQIEINRAIEKKKQFQANPEAHRFNWEPDNE